MKIKNYLIGVYVTFLPLLLFLDINNLRQISNKSIVLITLSIIIFYIIILLLYKIYQVTFKPSYGDNLFPGLCFVFYLQFYYADIKINFEYFLVNSGIYIFIFLIALSIVVIFFWKEYYKYLNKFAFIFSILVTTTFVYNFFIFSDTKTDYYKIKNTTSNQLSSINKQKDYNNIYLIIFDSLMPLEDFEKNVDKKIYNKIENKVSDSLKKIDKNFNYLNGAVSNYNNTKLSISSIFKSGYFINNKSKHFKNYFEFYPYILYEETKINNLDYLNVLKKNKIKFLWFSNHTLPCKNRRGIICGTDSNVETDIINEIKIFYTKTVLVKLLDNLTKKLHNDIPSDNLIKYVKNNKSKNNFFFIHNMIPNGEAIYDENCNKTYSQYPYYIYSYLCSIKKIQEITETIVKYDNDATVLITADHGVKTSFLSKKNSLISKLDDNIYYDPRVYALAKYPINCSKLLPKTYDIINLSRFLLNCNYSENLEYLPYSYYRTFAENSLEFGSIVEDTKYYKEYSKKIKKMSSNK